MKKSLNPIYIVDNFLNAITMYRLVLYGLIILASASVVLSFTGLLSLSGPQLLVSFITLIISCYVANNLISYFWPAVTNKESWLVTALILGCILPPPNSIGHTLALVLAGVIAMASKYVIAVYNKHLVNPAAFAALVLGVAGLLPATWWVGSPAMLPFTLLFGFLLLRKLRRFQLFGSFVLASALVLFLVGLGQSQTVSEIAKQAVLSSPLIFLGTVMLTEPLTMPPKVAHQIIYGAMVGGIFASQFVFGNLTASPELALIIGNLFSYAVSPKRKLLLRLKHKVQLSEHVYDFVFASNHRLAHEPGQYMEWTLPVSKADMRGNRRTFTIASSPTEHDIHLGVKLSNSSSSFKTALQAMHPGDTIVAGHLGGDFVLPKDINKKLVFVAGGIGITPFRSMVKHLIDSNIRRDIVLLYMIAEASEISYADIFEQAANLGVRLVPVLSTSGGSKPPTSWTGKTGYLTPDMIRDEVPDYAQRTFYMSGPSAMVSNYTKMLHGMKVPRSSIKKDYFSGY